MTVRVRVEGLKDLEVQLQRLRTATAKAALQRAGVSAMQPMAKLARQLAPKDTHELAESIDVGIKATNADVGKVAFARARRGGASESEAVQAMRDARRAAAGVRGPFAVDIFMGPIAGRTADEVIKGFVQEYGSFSNPPQPYMRPAFDQDRDAMLARLRQEIWFEVSSAIARAQARGTLRG